MDKAEGQPSAGYNSTAIFMPQRRIDQWKIWSKIPRLELHETKSSLEVIDARLVSRNTGGEKP